MKALSTPNWIKSGFYSIGSRASILIFGFGTFYFLVRILPKSEFGAWSIFLTITTIIEMSRNGLIQNALIKLLHSNEQSSSSAVVTASWVLNVVYSLIVYILLVAISPMLQSMLNMEGLADMFLYFGITLLLLIPISQYNYLQQANFSYSGIFWTAFVRQGILFGSVLIMFIINYTPSVVHLVLIQAGCTLLALVVAFLVAQKYHTYGFVWETQIIKKVFHFGKYVMGTNIFSLLFKSVDQLAIGYFLNASGVAAYSAAMRLSNMVEYPATSVAEVAYPYSTSQIKEKGEHVTKSIYEKSVGLTLTITLPIVLIIFLFSDIIIYIIAGSQYAEAANILRITILFGLITPFNRQFGMAMDSSNRPHLNFMLLGIALLINIINNVIGIHYFGLLGAAYGTLVSYIIISVLGHLILVRYFKVNGYSIYLAMISFYQQGWFFIRKRFFQNQGE